MRRLILGFVALALALVHPAPASADAAGGWYDGGIAYTDVLNCTSVIQGNAYSEKGIGAYAGYFADPDSGKPSTNQTFWIHYSVYGLGNPCAGGTYFRPTFYLPAGVTFDTTQQIQCAYDDHGGPAPQAACPGWSNMSAGTYQNDQDNGLWGVAQGHHWEFQFPVRATQPLSGSNLTVSLATADGNNNPTLNLTAPIYVFPGGGQSNAGAQILYDTPSSFAASTNPPELGGGPTRYGFASMFQAITNGGAGTVRLQLGTSSTAPQWLYDFSYGGGASSFQVWTDWEAPGFPTLAPNTTYYWRGAFFPNSGAAAYGAWQSFTTNANATGVTSSAAVGETRGGPAGGLSGGGTLGSTLTPTAIPPAAPTVTAKVKGRLVSTRRGKIAVAVTSSRGAVGRIVIREKGRVLGRGTLVNGSVVVTLNRKLRTGRHVFAVSYSGSSVTKPGARNLRAVVRRR